MFKQSPSRNSSKSLKSVLLLTACINPGVVQMLARRDPAIRLGDYQRALKEWMRVKEIDAIVFCENSLADLSSLETIVEMAKEPRPEVEFLSFQGQDFDPTLGKGYGEMRIIRYALEHSRLMASADMIVKVTGRLFISNVAPIAKSATESEGIDLFCDLRMNLTSADSRFFCATRTFLKDYLLPYEETVNDSRGICFENVLARAAHRAMADGKRCALPSRAHRMKGVEGTNNQTIPSGFFTQAQRELFRLVKALVLMR